MRRLACAFATVMLVMAGLPPSAQASFVAQCLLKGEYVGRISNEPGAAPEDFDNVRVVLRVTAVKQGGGRSDIQCQNRFKAGEEFTFHSREAAWRQSPPRAQTVYVRYFHKDDSGGLLRRSVDVITRQQFQSGE